MQTLAKSWWLLLLCGILEVVYCGMNFFMLRPDGTLAVRTFVSRRSTIVDMGILALGAGLCVIAAAIWNSRKISAWLLALNGIALSVLGLIFMFWTGPLSYRTIALLFTAMAISAGVYELAIARTARWPWIAAGIVSFAFAVAFLSFASRWIELANSPKATFIWMGSYFAFSAICMFILSAKTEPKALAAL
jgi:uncharacterized membrane protein HdeD (DUF308 family)